MVGRCAERRLALGSRIEGEIVWIGRDESVARVAWSACTVIRSADSFVPLRQDSFHCPGHFHLCRPYPSIQVEPLVHHAFNHLKVAQPQAMLLLN